MSRELSETDLDDATLILTFTERQRGLAARMVPSSRDRLFTLLEASTLAATISSRRLEPGGLEEWVHLLDVNRPTLALPAESGPRSHRWWQFARKPAEPTRPWDIPDAHSAAPAVHAERLARVAEQCQRLGTILAGGNG